MIFSIQTSLVVGFLAIIPIAISLWLKKSFFWSIKGRHVVITGGSSDIGLWIAIKCVKLGAHVTLLGRNVKKLETAEEKIKLFRVNDKQMVQSRTIDLSKSYDEVSHLMGTLEDEIAPIYWLVNCAGGEMQGRHIDIFPDDAIYLMNVKYYAVYYPTRYALTQMKKRGEGKITITGSQAKELVLEYYGHRPINFDIWKRSSHGLADMVNGKDLIKNISITLILTNTDTHDFGHGSFENDLNRVHIISDRNAPKSEDIANQIVCDSLNGKKISTLGWENWINLHVWKFSHLLQNVLQRLRQINLNKNGNGQVKIDTAPIAAQLPSKFIDCLSWQTHDTEKSADVPTNPNANENSSTDVLPVEQPSSDEPSSDADNNSVAQQEDNVEYARKTHESNSNCARPSETEKIKEDDQVENTTVIISTSPSKSAGDAALPIAVQSSLDSSSDSLPTSTVESKNDIDFDGPPKKLASTSMFAFLTAHDYHKPTSSITKNIGTVSSSSIPAEPNSAGDAIGRNEPAPHREVEQADGQKSIVNSQQPFMLSTSSFETAKKVFSVDASNGFNGSSDVASSTKSTHENTAPENLDVLHKKILSLYTSTDVAAKIPPTNGKDEKLAFPIASATGPIGMEMFDGKVAKVKPSFSFNLMDKPAKPAEPGITFSFNINNESDAEKPFMFEAKSMENVSDKATRESINPKSKLPTRATIKRMKCQQNLWADIRSQHK